MTWVLHVLLMNDVRSLQGILSENYFNTETECNKYYKENKIDIDDSIDSILKKHLDKYEIIHVGCMKTTSKMEIK